MTKNEMIAQRISLDQGIKAINEALSLLPKDKWVFKAYNPEHILIGKRSQLAQERLSLGMRILNP